MANLANFVVVKDSWTQEALSNGIDFQIQSNIDLNKMSVLTFMLKANANGKATFALRVNGKKVWDFYLKNKDYLGAYQEALDGGIIKAGTNTISFESDTLSGGSLDFSSVEFSDIVLWYRVSA